jgi:hypothetical protein
MNVVTKIGRTIRAVLWSFLGIRRGAEFQADVESLTPFHILCVGISMCFLFVISLMVFVHWVVKI